MKEEEQLSFEKNMLTCKEIAGIYCITSKSIISIHSTPGFDKTKVFMQLNSSKKELALPIIKATGKTRAYIRKSIGEAYMDIGIGEHLDEARDCLSLRGVRIK
jgi:hypothetical protein